MEKQEKIVQMFNDIAPTYDLANRVLSMGADVSWRKIACKTVLSNFKDSSVNIVDVACGTGDMMGFWQKTAGEFNAKIENLIGVPQAACSRSLSKNFPSLNLSRR